MARLPIPQIPGHEVVNSDDIELNFDNLISGLAIAVNKRKKKEGRCQDDTQEEENYR